MKNGPQIMITKERAFFVIKEQPSLQVLRLQTTRMEFSRPSGIPLNITLYDRPSRIRLARDGQKNRTLILLAAGADEDGTLNDQDALCGKLAEELTLQGFLVAVADYRKFNRGVARGDWNGLFNFAFDDLTVALGFSKQRAGDWNFDVNRVVVAGLSYGGMIQANIAHGQSVIGLAMGSGFIAQSDLPQFLDNKNIPVAILHNRNDGEVPSEQAKYGNVGGGLIAAELKRRGKTVFDTYLTTPCADGNHVPVVGADTEEVVMEYVKVFAANITKLVP